MSKRAIKMEDDAWPCEALELAVASMKDTEEADVIVNDPAFGFGAAGAPDAGVPAGAVVTYNLRLHSFVNGPDTYDMSGADKLERATSFKTRGNAAFKVRLRLRLLCKSPLLCVAHLPSLQTGRCCAAGSASPWLAKLVEKCGRLADIVGGCCGCRPAR